MNAFTLFHVALSLVGILAGLVVVIGLIGSRPGRGWTAVFLWSTAATILTGFLFPIHGFTPALGLGIVATPVMALALYAWHARPLAGAWRVIYVVTAVLSLYLNFFVLVVQSFQKIPALKALAPTQAEPPFAIAQGIALLGFLVLGTLAVKKFKAPAPAVYP